MGIFNNILNFFADEPRFVTRVEPQVQQETKSNPSNPSDVKKDFAFDSPNPLFGFGNIFPANTGVPVTPYTSLGHPVFFAGVKGIADDISRMPLLFERRVKDGWIAEDKNTLIKVLRRPNDWMTSFNLWHFTVTSLLIWGNAFIFIDRDDRGNVRRLVPIIPSQCSILVHSDYEITYSFTHPLWNGGGGVITEAINMLHFRHFSLDGGLRGLSSPAVSQDALGVGIACQTHSATFFRDGTLLQGLLSTPNRLTTEGAARMAESWKQAQTGAPNAHKVAVLEEALSFVPMAQTAEQAQLLEARKFGHEDAARLLRIAPVKVGIMEHANFSNVEAQNLSYLQDALLPITENFQAELSAKLLSEKEMDDYRFRWDFSNLLQTDTDTQFKAFEKALMNGFMSINEVRSKLGLPPDPDGDKLRAPLNTAPIDAIGDQPIGKPTTPKPKGDAVVSDEDAEDNKS